MRSMILWLMASTVWVSAASSQTSVKTEGTIETDGQLKSNAASGTAPLVVASDTLVPNLNADQVDGLEGTDLANLAMAVQDEVAAQNACRAASGALGTLLEGVCLLDHDNLQTSTWSSAVAGCMQLGGDLCSVAQYASLREGDWDLFYNNRSVWSCDFSDNDAGSKSIFIYSSDDPSSSQQYSYGCCGRATPEPYRSDVQTINGVPVTLVHDKQDTTFRAAARICHARGSDLCSKSQYTALTGLFPAATRRASRDMSDNDVGLFDGVVGTNTGDNPAWTDPYAFACCASLRPADGSCPGTLAASGLCYESISDGAAVDFFAAASACHAAGADVCSKSQMQALRDGGLFVGESWTSDGADNDSRTAGGLLGSQPDNPDPSSDQFGYACCY